MSPALRMKLSCLAGRTVRPAFPRTGMSLTHFQLLISVPLFVRRKDSVIDELTRPSCIYCQIPRIDMLPSFAFSPRKTHLINLTSLLLSSQAQLSLLEDETRGTGLDQSDFF